MTQESTILLYIILFAFSVLMIAFSHRKTEVKAHEYKYDFYSFFFILAFFPLWILSCFTDIGADYENYYNIIEDSRYYLNEFGIIECVFYLLCVFLYDIFHKPDVVIFILKTLTLVLYFKVMYMLRYKAVLWPCALAFVLLCFLEFYLISMHLAIAFLLISILNFIDGKIKTFVINYVLACFIHSSALLFIPVIAVYYLFKCNKVLISKGKLMFLAMVCIVAFITLTALYEYAITTIPFFKQYAAYNLMTNYDGSGLMQYVYYLPILYFGIQVYKNKFYSIQYKNSFLIFSIFLFLFGLVGYKIEVFGRMANYAIMIQMIFIPIYFYARNTTLGYKGLFSKNVEMFCWIFFLLSQGIITFWGKINSETSQLDQWHFFLPF